jgi:hypothetical protein
MPASSATTALSIAAASASDASHGAAAATALTLTQNLTGALSTPLAGGSASSNVATGAPKQREPRAAAQVAALSRRLGAPASGAAASACSTPAAARATCAIYGR